MTTYQAKVKARVEAANAQVIQDAAGLPTCEDALMLLAAEAYQEIDRAICIGDRAASRAARRRIDAIAFNLSGRDIGYLHQTTCRIEARLAPAPGIVPTWGLNGEYLVVVDGIKVRCVKLGAHLTLHAVDPDSAFISETGLRSCTEGYGFNGDVQAATLAKIRTLIAEGGRVAIRPEHRDHVRASQPAWVSDALEALDAPAAGYQEPTGQMAFTF